MTALLGSLFFIIVRLDMERGDEPWGVIAGVWWPISLYSGWITVAWLANLGAYLVSEGASFPTSPAWAWVLILAVVFIALGMIFWRNMREYSMVAVWALLGVAARHLQGSGAHIAAVAIAGAVVLVAAAGYHAKKNFRMPPPDRSFG